VGASGGVHSVTDRWADEQTDDMMMPIAHHNDISGFLHVFKSEDNTISYVFTQ